ncbi:MAG: hypothetical protein AAFV98_05530 [Chloroflexota bacterium]
MGSNNKLISRSAKFTAMQLTVWLLALYAALLGGLHGYFLMQQGIVTDTVFVSAIGDPCQPALNAHACWPAMTIFPDLTLSGIVTICIAVVFAFWVIWGTRHTSYGFTIFLLSIVLLLTGGGFLPPLYGCMAAFLMSRSPNAWVRQIRFVPQRISNLLGNLWATLLAVYFLWVGVQLVFYDVLNDILLEIGNFVLIAEICLLLLACFAAINRDKDALFRSTANTIYHKGGRKVA